MSGRCIRKGDRDPGQCSRCIYRDGTGEDVEPLVQRIDHKKRPSTWRCLTFREVPPDQVWRSMALHQDEQNAARGQD